MQNMLAGIVALSESLRLQRPDGGHLPVLLDRPDMVNFLNRLAFLAETGKISPYTRINLVRHTRQIMNRVRVLGLTGPGQPLESLPASFALSLQDIPDEPGDTEAGRDLPDEVMRQLCDNLDLLEKSSSREVRVAVELLIDTGRRPDEIATLPLECLRKDPDGKLTLVYDNHKAYWLGRTLPISKATAAVITAQQEAVRRRFPDTPAAELKLLPSPVANPEGKKSITTIGDPRRAWVVSLPDFLVPVVVEEHGQPKLVMLPFDKSKIFLYAYRCRRTCECAQPRTSERAQFLRCGESRFGSLLLGLFGWRRAADDGLGSASLVGTPAVPRSLRVRGDEPVGDLEGDRAEPPHGP